jgi:hypothetical protein
MKDYFIKDWIQILELLGLPVITANGEADPLCAYMLKNNPHIKSRVKGINNIKKQIYYLKVWLLTESNDLTVLKNHDKRGFKKYHLDHIFPISVGFKEQIPPKIIADMRNLQFLYHRKNIKNSDDVDENSRKLINEIIKTYEKNN